MQPYIPIHCDTHSQLELHVMHRKPLQIDWLDEAAIRRRSTGVATDIRTVNGKGEYLIFQDESGVEHQIRLDKLLAFIPNK